MTREEMDAMLEPSLYTGRSAEQVSAYLAELRPLLEGDAKSTEDVNI